MIRNKSVVMGGMMRVKTNFAKRVATTLAFSLVIPLSPGNALALPRKPPQTVPASMPSSMKLKEPKQERDPTSMVASMRAASGSMIRNMLRARDYKRLVKLHRKLNDNVPASQQVKVASGKLAEELNIFKEAESFESKDRLHIVIISVFLNSDNFLFSKSSKSKLVDAYSKSIDSLGFPKLAKLIGQWIKNGKGDKIALYKSLRTCCAADGGE